MSIVVFIILCRFYFYILLLGNFSFPYIVFISEIFEKNRKSDYFFNFLWILFCSAAINFTKSPHISARNGTRTRTDIPVQKIFSPHLLLYKPTWLSSRCGPAHFSTILKMLRNSNRIVISCIECLNVMPHGYFQRRCFLYVLYTFMTMITRMILCNLFTAHSQLSSPSPKTKSPRSRLPLS